MTKTRRIEAKIRAAAMLLYEAAMIGREVDADAVLSVDERAVFTVHSPTLGIICRVDNLGEVRRVRDSEEGCRSEAEETQ